MRTFALTAIAVVVLVVVQVRADDDPEPTPADRSKILGDWEVVDIKMNNKNFPFPVDQIKITMTFQKTGKVTMNTMGQQKEGTWKLDVRKSPRHLEMTQDNMPAALIYKFEKDKLVIGGSEGQAKDRPKDFESAQVTMTLKRVKK